MNSFSSQIEAAASFLREHDKFLVFSHLNPDPDAYGSQTAMGEILRTLAKNFVLVNHDGALERFRALPGVEEVRLDLPAAFEPQAIIFLDCGAKNRIGDRLVEQISQPRYNGLPVLNIDHHISNDLFGTVNLVDGSNSSTCELVYEVSLELGIAPSAKFACQLLCGIVGDTGSFRYSSTSARTLRIAADLVEAGGSLSFVSDRIVSISTEASLRLQANAFLHLKRCANGRIAGVVVTEEDYRRFGASIEDTENLAERVRDIQGVDIAYAIRAAGEKWKVSLRTSLKEIDLSAVASDFGGGGHRAASAFRFRGELSKLEELLTSRLEKALPKPLTQ